MSVNYKKTVMSLAVVAAMAPAASIAQEERLTLEEVIVTAQKRAQSLQDVPISVSAFSGDAIRKANITNAKQMARMTPGVTGESNDSFLDAINVRGIVTNDFGVGAEPSVGLYQDGVYLGRTGGAVTSFYDIERVEILKGPQGTLFGRNAAAGAISTTTKKPSLDEQEGEISLGLGQHGHRAFTGVANLPLNDSWAVRAAYHHEEADGWVENALGGPNLGDSKTDAGRLGIAYETVDFSALLSLEYEDRLQTPSIYAVYDPENSGLPNWQNGSTKIDEVVSDLGSQMHDKGNVWTTNLTMEWDLSEQYSLTSITALRGHNYSYLEDFDGSALAIDHYGQQQKQDYFSQELRINYSGERLSWFAGVSAYREKLKASVFDRYDEDAQCSFQYAGDLQDPSYIYDGCGNSSYGYVYGLAYSYSFSYAGIDYTNPAFAQAGAGLVTDQRQVDAEYQGWGIYGDASFDVTEELELTVGARYTVDERDFGLKVAADPSRNYPSVFGFPYHTADFVRDSNTWENFSPRIALSWKPSDEFTLFTSVSQGYKAGGYNSNGMVFTGMDVDGNPYSWTSAMIANFRGLSGDGSTPTTSVDATSNVALERFDEEKVTNFEVGIKSRLWDDRMQLNASVFAYEFEDYQVNFYDPDQATTRVTNAGDAQGRGFELDLKALLTDNLEVYLGYSWLDTELKTVKDFRICDNPLTCEGSTLPGSVEQSLALIATYTVSLGDGDLSFTVENTYQDDASAFADFDDRQSIRQDDFNLVNLRASYGVGDTWEVSVFAENVTDEKYYKGASYSDFAIGPHKVDPAKPRFYGVEASYRF